MEFSMRRIFGRVMWCWTSGAATGSSDSAPLEALEGVVTEGGALMRGFQWAVLGSNQ
jgi:hypothetical protein